MKRILVTTDFSEESKSVCAHIRDFQALIGAQNCEIILLHVLETPVLFDTSDLGVSYTQIDRVMEEAAESCEARIAEFAAQEFPGLQVKTLIKRVQGQIQDEIAETARLEQADLIAIATHGRTGFQRLVLGSVAEKVIRVATVPVLVVPIKQPIAES